MQIITRLSFFASLLLLCTAKEIRVNVGETGNTFSPAKTEASVGDSILFVFYQDRLMVTQSSYETPCQQSTNTTAFNTDTVRSKKNSDLLPTRILQITDVQPIYFFGGNGASCEAGFVGAVNAPLLGNTYEMYRKQATTVDGTSASGRLMGSVSLLSLLQSHGFRDFYAGPIFFNMTRFLQNHITMHPAIKAGNVALITGSAYGGIGFAFARQLAVKHGMKVALADFDLPNLLKAEKILSEANVPKENVFISKTDVSQLSEMQSLAEAVWNKFGGVDVLHLNAGTGGSSSCTGGLEAWTKILGVNFYGVLNGGQALASRMIDDCKKDAAIIVTGSKQGITCPPGSGPAYNVSKAAVKVFTEALAHEVRQKTNKITVSLLVPGFVFSKLAARGKDVDQMEKPKGAWTPDQTVDYMLEKLDRKEFYIICPDEETTEAMDIARMKWSANDPAEKRPALSRWHPDYKEKFEEHMKRETGA